jgi:predicted metal-dependent HD superfamily phosphohydrolase
VRTGGIGENADRGESSGQRALFDASWRRAWRNLQLNAPDGLQQRLLAAWAEPQRHYHAPQHLAECIAHFDDAAALAHAPGEVEIALWFHDAVYALKGKDNERRSADWARDALRAAGADAAAVSRVETLIMATCHEAVPQEADARLLVDIDLAILGAKPGRFAEYDAQVALEYAWVPRFVYRFKRRQVLRGFLSRPVIYQTEHFRDRLEAQAHANLTAATRWPGSRSPAVPQRPA